MSVVFLQPPLSNSAYLSGGAPPSDANADNPGKAGRGSE